MFTGIIPQIIKRRHLSTELEIVSEEKLCYFLYIFFTGSSVGDFPKYTYCGNYNRQIQNLARIVPEKWSFGGNDDNGILKGYLEHTFQRVYEEEKLLETEEYAIFNTGLFNMYYQPVYAYFIPNLVPDRQRWFLDGFYTEYHLLKSGIVNLPKRAAYVTDPAELIFDTGLDIVPQYEHIFEETENCQRLPETIRGSVMKVQLFDGALRQTKRMLEADYRTAIPQYYNHGIQFLIPVCLQNPDRADLALACVKTEDGSKYLGRTCLTLKMAYHNARLLAKIHSSWLYP